MPRRLNLSLKPDDALQVTRISIGNNKLVYILVADKSFKYKCGNSRICYIGTTKNGVSRIALSVAYRAKKILSFHGIRTIHARIVTCKLRKKIETWKKLERALLLKFREKFGEVPRCNSHGKKMKETNEFQFFSHARIKTIIEDLN